MASGERTWLYDARLASREIFNQTIRLTQQGYTHTEIQNEVDRDDFLRNNKCAVVGKALQTWDSYQSLKEWWENQDDPDRGKPTPPSTDKTGAYPLVMAHTEGYRLTVDDETNRVQFRISAKPQSHIKGHLRGEPDAMDELRNALCRGVRSAILEPSYRVRGYERHPRRNQVRDVYYNSQTCSWCGERGNRQGGRFRCPNDVCDVVQDHADRNASVNIAWLEKAKLDDNTTYYRTHKIQPQVRLVRLSGSGRVSRPASSRSLAEQGVLAQG